MQLATIDVAERIFTREVLEPAEQHPPGVRRIVALTGAFCSYPERRVFPGGCFFAATGGEFAGRDGPVADRIRDLNRASLGEPGDPGAGGAGSRRGLDPVLDADQLAFEIDSLMLGGHAPFALFDDLARSTTPGRPSVTGSTRPTPPRGDLDEAHPQPRRHRRPHSTRPSTTPRTALGLTAGPVRHWNADGSRPLPGGVEPVAAVHLRAADLRVTWSTYSTARARARSTGRLAPPTSPTPTDTSSQPACSPVSMRTIGRSGPTNSTRPPERAALCPKTVGDLSIEILERAT
ncbi:MAG: hypothetical protein M5T61_20390 [Acidimicrobiia bacterium]|nr:hypothetical protein [Acidimicrobiia bacterium]